MAKKKIVICEPSQNVWPKKSPAIQSAIGGGSPFNSSLVQDPIAVCDCADVFRILLELIHQIVLKPTPEKKAKLATVSNEVASHVREVIAAAQAIRGVYVHGDGSEICML